MAFARARSAVVAAAVLGWVAGGCGRPAPAPAGVVRGAVRLNGRPLAGGLVVFAPDRDKGTVGKPATAAVGPDGTYRLAGPGGDPVPAGWYRVALADAPAAGPVTGPPFPAALRRPDRSGLEREVRGGVENVFVFEIDVPE